MLKRLLRAASRRQEEQMPFGFDTRVLARVREAPANGSALIGLFARRVTAIALAVIAFAAAGLYGAAVSNRNAEVTNEYGIVDKAIQNNLGE